MKKNKLNNSLDRMKYLFEFTYKTNSADVGTEHPVKFNEIGDKYVNKPKSDYPAFQEYLDEVIIDEAEPVDDGSQQPQQPQQPVAPEQQPQAAPAPQPPATPDMSQQAPMPDPQMSQQPVADPNAGIQPPVAPEPVQAPPTDLGGSVNTELDTKLSDQIAKTEELLLKISDIDQKLASVDSVSSKIDHLSNEVESIKNPSLDDQIELISKNSYPYNVKLNDYWGWGSDEEKEPEAEEFKADVDDINSYNKEDIKNSFNITENKK